MLADAPRVQSSVATFRGLRFMDKRWTLGVRGVTATQSPTLAGELDSQRHGLRT